MSRPSKDNFEQTLQIAEFASQRGENRRQYEFKIFISYVTLLVLAIYEGHHIEVPNDAYKELSRFFIVALIVALLSVIHFFYIAWTISLSVANQNDGARRDFYLQKSECISRRLLMEFGDPLSQKLDNEYSKLCSNKKINIVPKFYEVWEHKNQLWINYAAAFQVVLPTIIFFLLVLNLSNEFVLNLSNELCTGWRRAAVLLMPLLTFILIIAISTCCRKKGAKTP